MWKKERVVSTLRIGRDLLVHRARVRMIGWQQLIETLVRLGMLLLGIEVIVET